MYESVSFGKYPFRLEIICFVWKLSYFSALQKPPLGQSSIGILINQTIIKEIHCWTSKDVNKQRLL